MSRWPFPGDSPADRARQVCMQYRKALQAVDPKACEAIDQAADWVGESWVLEELAVETEEDLVSVRRAAELVGRSTRWIYILLRQEPTLVRAYRPMRVRLSDVRLATRRRGGDSGVSGDIPPAPIRV